MRQIQKSRLQPTQYQVYFALASKAISRYNSDCVFENVYVYVYTLRL